MPPPRRRFAPRPLHRASCFLLLKLASRRLKSQPTLAGAELVCPSAGADADQHTSLFCERLHPVEPKASPPAPRLSALPPDLLPNTPRWSASIATPLSLRCSSIWLPCTVLGILFEVPDVALGVEYMAFR